MHYIRQPGFAPQGPFADEKVVAYIVQGKVRPGMSLSKDGQVWVGVEHHPLYAQAMAGGHAGGQAEQEGVEDDVTEPAQEADYVDCPECAEPVRSRARTCRHCGHDLTGQRRAPTRPARPPARPTPRAVQPMFVVTAKSPGVALLLSLIVPGAGQMYAGAIGKGVFIMFALPILLAILGWIMLFGALSGNPGSLAGLVGVSLAGGVAWLWQCFDAVSTANRANASLSRPLASFRRRSRRYS